MEENLLHEVLTSSPSKFALIQENAERFRFQALLSYVNVDSSGRPTLTRHGYRVDHEYFYPASAIKLCGAVAALYKLEHLQKSLGLNVTLTTPLAFYPLQEGEPLVEHDPSNVVDGTITLAHEIRKLCLVSDNVAFNRLYAFSGQRYINERMWQLGLQTTRVQHRLSTEMSTEENKYCEPVEMRVPGMSATLPPKKNADCIHSISELKGLKIGAGHVLKNGEVVMQPMDFSKKNYISLLDLQNLLIKILCQDVELLGEPCKLFHGSQMLLREAMADYPLESSNPAYLKSEFPDDYFKLFLPGVCRVRPKKALRIFNKVGRAYGFTIENSYIFDKERGQGFFLSAVIYTNNNGILNDDEYEYEDVADRMMADLGEMVARAVWKLPPTHVKVSPCFDCIPSSLWKELQRPSHRANTSDEVEVSQVEIHMGAVDLHIHTFDNLRPKPMIGAFQLSSSVLPISSDSGPSILSKLEGDASLVKCEPSVMIACCFKYFLNG